jgi:hypothetical protein
MRIARAIRVPAVEFGLCLTAIHCTGPRNIISMGGSVDDTGVCARSRAATLRQRSGSHAIYKKATY